MALIRRNNYFDPFRELESLQNEMNNLFNFSLGRAFDRDAGLLEGTWSPAVDIYDAKDNYMVKADLPGLSKKDINVTIKNNHLIIEGEKSQEKKEKEENCIRTERFTGSFRRSIAFPTDVDADKVKANFKNGTLEMELPKKEEARPKQIQVDVT